MRKDVKDMVGYRTGSRVCISYAGEKKWLNRCDCGKEFITSGSDLRRRIYLCNHIIQQRFFSKVKKTDDCWIWLGAKNSDGYGSFKNGNKNVSSHLFSWKEKNGNVPSGKELDHLCRNRLCVNPDHLEPVSHKENVNRGNMKSVVKSRGYLI